MRSPNLEAVRKKRDWQDKEKIYQGYAGIEERQTSSWWRRPRLRRQGTKEGSQTSGIRSSGGMFLGIGQNGEKMRGRGEMEIEEKTEG